MISIIIPLYNKEQYIAHTLQSVLEQSYQDFEIVVINDGSTDNSLAETEKIVDPRIRIYNQTNSGVSAARNKGIEIAKGEIVAFLDADDIWNKDYLKTIYNLVTLYPSADVFATKYNKMRDGKNKDIIVNKLPFKEENGILENYFEVASCSEPPIWSSAVAVKKTAIQGIGGFPVGIKAGEDLLTWARLAVKFKIAYSTKVMATFVLPDSNIAKKAPTRKLDSVDYVGNSFHELYKHNPNISGLKEYNASWHKMRAVNALGYLELKEVRTESWKAICYNPRLFKLYVLLLLSILPTGIARLAYRKFVKNS